MTLEAGNPYFSNDDRQLRDGHALHAAGGFPPPRAWRPPNRTNPRFPIAERAMDTQPSRQDQQRPQGQHQQQQMQQQQ